MTSHSLESIPTTAEADGMGALIPSPRLAAEQEVAPKQEQELTSIEKDVVAEIINQIRQWGKTDIHTLEEELIPLFERYSLIIQEVKNYDHIVLRGETLYYESDD